MIEYLDRLTARGKVLWQLIVLCIAFDSVPLYAIREKHYSMPERIIFC